MSRAKVKASEKTVRLVPLMMFSQMPMMKAPMDRAGDGADAAEDRRDEGLEAGHCAGERDDALIVREVQHAADGRERAAYDKGKAYDGVNF